MSLWSLGARKILIIDDFPDMRAMMRDMVVSLGGTDITTARNGEDAITLMELNRFNIVLCDYNLGEGKDGQQVLEEARYRDLLPYTTLFVMITAENSSMMVLGALEHAPDDYLSKPVTRTMLLTRLRAHTQKKERLAPVLEAMDRRNWSGALKKCEDMLEASQEHRFDLLQLKGILLLELGEFEHAAEFYGELMQIRVLPWMMLGLGKALAYSQQFPKALESLEEAIKTQPNLVASYDLLADILLQQGEIDRAKDVLTTAVAVSPKTATRHRRLGQIAYRQGDYASAESCFRTSLRLSRGSCLRGIGEYADLIQALIQKGDPVAAIKTVRDMQREFKQEPDASMQGAMLEWAAQSKVGSNTASQQAFDEAVAKFEQRPELMNCELALFIAQTCFEQGQAETATKLLGHVLRSHPDEPATRKRVFDIFSGAGNEAEGRRLANAITTEQANLGQMEAQLAQEGQPEEAIALLEQAAQPLPENIDLNLRVANRVIMFMQKHGKNPELMHKARYHLDRIRNSAGTFAGYRRLRTQLNQLASSA